MLGAFYGSGKTMTQSNILGVILAGGKSRRMGRQKPFVPLAGKPLVQHSIDRLRVQVTELVINVNDEHERYTAFGCPVIEDSLPGHRGPLVGVLDGLAWAREHKQDFRGIITLPCDIPFVPNDYVSKLILPSNDDRHTRYAVEKTGKHFLCAYWPCSVESQLREFVEAGHAKVETFHSSVGGVAVDFSDRAFDAFFNINTPEDVAVAHQMMLDHKMEDAK